MRWTTSFLGCGRNRSSPHGEGKQEEVVYPVSIRFSLQIEPAFAIAIASAGLATIKLLATLL